MLECGDGTYYTGYTNDLAKRFELHNAGKGAKYTKTHAPVRLVWSKKYSYYRLAVKEEARIKTLTRKIKEGMVLAYKTRVSIDDIVVPIKKQKYVKINKTLQKKKKSC